MEFNAYLHVPETKKELHEKFKTLNSKELPWFEAEVCRLLGHKKLPNIRHEDMLKGRM